MHCSLFTIVLDLWLLNFRAIIQISCSKRDEYITLGLLLQHMSLLIMRARNYDYDFRDYYQTIKSYISDPRVNIYSLDDAQNF